ncbi:MAG: hypothetical protein Q9219_006267 [cf. Caloplaca sp. 3 TL-2023]
MDQWLDSLSEDWVSQRRSPQSDQLRRSSSALSVASLTSNASQSRIPRYKPRSTSNLASTDAASTKRTSMGPSESNRKPVLKERSSSNLNIPRSREAETTIGSESPGAKRNIGSKRYASTTSIPSIPQDTVQHRNPKISPSKENDVGSTPDWKRRILQGKAGGTGPDLFAPIGLESIFKPPTVGRANKSGEKQKRGKRYQPVQIEEFPSSPPAFPSELGSADRSGGTDRRRSSLLKQMEILEEVSEGDSRSSLPRISSRGLEDDKSPPEMVDHRSPDAEKTEDDRNEVLSQVLLPKIPSVRSHQSLASRSQRSGGPLSSTYPKPESPKGQEDDQRVEVGPSPSVSEAQAAPMDDWTNHSLPDDLSTGTDLYVANGGFVNIRRGGYSNEGSFHRRPLSPSSLPDFDAPELRSPSPTRQTLSIRSRKSDVPEAFVNQPRSAPTTPHRKQQPNSNSPDGPRSSGSPLKLFDKYDTFTNERLIRRISRFERSAQEIEEEQSDHAPEQRNLVYEAEKRALSHDSHHASAEPASRRSSHGIDSFGHGQLDSYSFNAEHRYNPKSHPPVDDAEPNTTDNLVSDRFQFHGLTVEHQGVDQLNVQIDVVETVNGKRLPHSPAKESQAKRRRTLRSLEALKLEIHQHTAPAETNPRLPPEAHSSVQASSHPAEPPSQRSRSLAGQKRKDARDENDDKVADPKIPASRQLLRPRTPTPSQRGSQQPPLIKGDQIQMPNLDQVDGADSLARDLDHQTQALAGELANFTLNMAQDMTQGARKASVTTADFFNEAKQIMQLIRNQGRPQSSQAISEEEEPEDGGDEPRRSPIEQSTIDEFSRPPSREGGSLRRLREPAQLDARVASHLRKFEDTDDLGLALPSSVKSMHINHSHDPTLSPDKCVKELEAQSDPPNVRIRVQSSGPTSVNDVYFEQDGPATVTVTGPRSSRSESSGSSTNHSVPTGSSRGSRGSGTKAVIAPQVVSHLLSDNMGAMTFDHSKHIWVKRKSSQIPQDTGNHSRSGSDVTEDLFNDIPDLTVDVNQERERVKKAVASVKFLGSVPDHINNRDQLTRDADDASSVRPKTRDSAATETVDQSSAPSKLSRLASSGPEPETRVTSWGDDIVPRKVTHRQIPIGTEKQTTNDIHSEEVEHEISILEGRTSKAPHHGKQRQPRVVTVAFSSPLVDQVQFVKGIDEGAASWDDDSDLDLADSPIRNDARPLSASQRRTSSGFRKTSSYRNASRRVSIGMARPMSRVDENEELTFLQSFRGQHNASMELIVTTPLPVTRNTALPSASSSAQASSIGFQLSPLSEFTVHKSDELENQNAGKVTRHRGLLASHEVEEPLSLAIQDLVKKLTDVEPYEPYWDHIRHLNLRNRNLQTLHMLDEYCAHIEDLDVSNNEISQLHGAPLRIRHLRARDNCLSSLTSWTHLRNLQHLDISGNHVQSLTGFQSLVHLRELRADDNQVESLEGILGLDGLIRLTLRRNRIKAIDFEACNLPRLTDLDLGQNEVMEANHLCHLTGLKHLDLSSNKLENLSIPGTIPTLQDLRLANNELHTLDISQIPKLQLLDIDRNSIVEIDNLGAHKCLEVLSWREQCIDSDANSTTIQYQHCRNVRQLYLSGNTISVFEPDVHLLNLQHLELASTGLQSLADDFGVKCPNLRLLNLNFNALSELRPLLGIVSLEKLCLAGNRISRLRRTASVLDRIGSELAELDMRQNPLTLGYHIPQQHSRSSSEQRLVLASRSAVSDDARDDSFGSLRDQQLYQLPPMEQSVDDGARQRLDNDTKIRRRVYELLVTLRCSKLRSLDGLELDRRKIMSRDGVWERLRELGVVVMDRVGRGAHEMEG